MTNRVAFRSPGTAALAAALLAAALGLVGLGSKSLWYDETYTAWAIRGSWSRLWALIQDHESPHAAYYTIVKAWTDLAGRSEWALRLPSVVAAAISVPIVYFLGRRLFGARGGAIASVALAVNPFVIIWSQQARSYAFVLLAACLSTLALVRALERPTASRWALYALAAGAGLVVHLFSGLVLPAHAAAAAMYRPRPAPLGPLVAFAAVGVVGGWIARETASRPAVLTAWIQTPDVVDVVKGLLLVAGVGPLPIVIAMLAVRAARRRSAASWIVALLVLWAIGPFAVTVAVSFVEPVFAPRYLIGAVPPFALLTGYWLSVAGRRAAVGVATALATWSTVVLVFWYAAPPLEDWRGATAAALAAAKPGDDLLYAPPPAATGFEYYAGERTASSARSREVWLVVWGPSPDARKRSADEAVRRLGYALEERRPIDGWLTVERWARR